MPRAPRLHSFSGFHGRLFERQRRQVHDAISSGVVDEEWAYEVLDQIRADHLGPLPEGLPDRDELMTAAVELAVTPFDPLRVRRSRRRVTLSVHTHRMLCEDLVCPRSSEGLPTVAGVALEFVNRGLLDLDRVAFGASGAVKDRAVRWVPPAGHGLDEVGVEIYDRLRAQGNSPEAALDLATNIPRPG